MVQYEDTTVAVGETKSARKELRMKPAFSVGGEGEAPGVQPMPTPRAVAVASKPFSWLAPVMPTRMLSRNAVSALGVMGVMIRVPPASLRTPPSVTSVEMTPMW